MGLSLSLTMAGCGGTPGSESPFDRAGEGEAVIVVDNSRTAVSEMTVYLLPSGGVRRRLGTVTLNEESSFTVRDVEWGATYRFVADVAGSGDVTSRPFELLPGTVVEWDVYRNNVHFRDRTGGG